MSPEGPKNDNSNNLGEANTLNSFLGRSRGGENSIPNTQGSEIADEGDTALNVLEAKGFTADEAVRLMHVADCQRTSREVRDSEAMLNRLLFTRWMIKQGILDEFSA